MKVPKSTHGNTIKPQLVHWKLIMHEKHKNLNYEPIKQLFRLEFMYHICLAKQIIVPNIIQLQPLSHSRLKYGQVRNNEVKSTMRI